MWNEQGRPFMPVCDSKASSVFSEAGKRDWKIITMEREKGMATHSSILAWEIPWTEEPDGLQSMRSKRVGHD